MDLDMCQLEAKPFASDDDLLAKAKVDEYERSNMVNLMVIKRAIFETIFCGILSTEKLKSF